MSAFASALLCFLLGAEAVLLLLLRALRAILTAIGLALAAGAGYRRLLCLPRSL